MKLFKVVLFSFLFCFFFLNVSKPQCTPVPQEPVCNCDDGNACTDDICQSDGKCVNEVIEGCMVCETSNDCYEAKGIEFDPLKGYVIPGEPCLNYSCKTGVCGKVKDPNCCESDSECNVYNECSETQDQTIVRFTGICDLEKNQCEYKKEECEIGKCVKDEKNGDHCVEDENYEQACEVTADCYSSDDVCVGYNCKQGVCEPYWKTYCCYDQDQCAETSNCTNNNTGLWDMTGACIDNYCEFSYTDCDGGCYDGVCYDEMPEGACLTNDDCDINGVCSGENEAHKYTGYCVQNMCEYETVYCPKCDTEIFYGAEQFFCPGDEYGLDFAWYTWNDYNPQFVKFAFWSKDYDVALLELDVELTLNQPNACDKVVTAFDNATGEVIGAWPFYEEDFQTVVGMTVAQPWVFADHEEKKLTFEISPYYWGGNQNMVMTVCPLLMKYEILDTGQVETVNLGNYGCQAVHLN